MGKRSGWSPYYKNADQPGDYPNADELAHPERSRRVVGIGAVCDFRTGAPEPESSRGQGFSIKEFVELEDGRRVVVDHRGWSTSSVREIVELEDGQRVVLENVAPAGAGETPDSIRQHVLNVVLPDDEDEALKEAHPWSHLAECARRQGIEVTADELKSLDYKVILTERLVRWLETP